jgi:N-acyl-D-aspartate/D-glutamate deacylase
VSFEWSGLEVEAVNSESHRDWVGRSITELADERGQDALDTFLDLALEEDLETRFQTRMSDVAKQFIAHVVKSSVADPIVMPGSSDGGAHLASFVGADYTTRLLTDWVPDPLSLEQAIWRNTLMPATVHGITDRGILREGAFADVLAIDLGALAAGSSHLRRDFPADSERYVVEAEGYRAMVVNGEVLMEDGRHTGALPGMVLKGG